MRNRGSGFPEAAGIENHSWRGGTGLDEDPAPNGPNKARHPIGFMNHLLCSSHDIVLASLHSLYVLFR
jgi:hypothetical protein